MPLNSEARALRPAPLFSDHAVLQRGDWTRIWGSGAPGDHIRIKFASEEVRADVGNDGQWEAFLHDLKAGGPHTLRIDSAKESCEFKDVLVGDVWLCSGQSNMQWTMEDVLHAEADIASAAALKKIRLYLVPKNGTKEPLSTLDATWTANNPGAVRNFSAVAQYFAEELRRSPSMLDVPIGLIDSSFGGTRVEAWIPRDVLDTRFKGYALRESFFGFPPASMWNAMIAPVASYGISGVLWYQGESNAKDGKEYADLLTGMITVWRERWTSSNLPFFIVQLPNHAERFVEGYFTAVREAQAKVAATMQDAYLAVAIDTGDGFDVHPKSKEKIGLRLGLLARAHRYGESIVATGPVAGKPVFKGDSVKIPYSSPDGILRSATGDALSSFAVAGDDGIFKPGRAQIVDDGVLVQSTDGSPVHHVRYAWEGNPKASLYNGAGLPAAPFRSDNLPFAEVEIEQLPVSWRMDGGAWSMTLSGEGRVVSLRGGASEFLAAGDPARPGAFFGTEWGPSRLFDIRAVSNRELLAVIEFCSLSIMVEGDGMTWTLKNRKATPLGFHVALADGVAADQSGEGVRLSHGPDTMFLGNGSFKKTGSDLVLQLGPREEKVITVRFTPPAGTDGSKDSRTSAPKAF